NVVINELLAYPAPGQLAFIELYNRGPQPVDLSGAFLGTDLLLSRFQIPAGTVLPPAGFLALDQSQLGFGLAAGGGSIYLVNSNLTKVVDAVRFEGQARGF